jgi:hypothetical protein
MLNIVGKTRNAEPFLATTIQLATRMIRGGGYDGMLPVKPRAVVAAEAAMFAAADTGLEVEV